jgi:pimeloyl-[acyl-carrier protein] methyl ester esterase
MKTAWLRKEGAEELLLFFNGWGMDRRIGDHLLAESLSDGFDADLLLCYDYRTLETEPGFMREASRYGRITVIAWSFGVWAAQHVELPLIERSIAINGTLHPVNSERGINPLVFESTLATWSEKSRNRFNRRMCGSAEALALFSSMSPDRTTADQQVELEQLQEHFLADSPPCGAEWRYDHSIIGGRDLVFPAEQQYRAWKGLPQTVIADMPHFPFFHFRNLQEVLACIR